MTFKLNHLKYCSLKNKVYSPYALSNNDCMDSFQNFVDKLKEKKIKSERTYTTISSISSKYKSSKSNINININTVSDRKETKKRPISIKNINSDIRDMCKRFKKKTKDNIVNRSYQSSKKNNLSLRDYVIKTHTKTITEKDEQNKKHKRNYSSSNKDDKKETMNYDKCKE